MAPDNCAVGPDGQLLDASKITWYNDPDDDTPMAPTTTLPSTVQGRPSVTTLDSFVTKVAPATRRSARAPRPSTKLIDPDNVMTLKRKASDTGTNPSRRHRQASPEYEEEEATEPDPTPTDTEGEPDPIDSDIEDDDEDLVDSDAAYEETKALGDADREVRVDFLLLWYIFDVLQRPCARRPRMIAQRMSVRFSKKSGRRFIRKQERKSPSTGAFYAGTF